MPRSSTTWKKREKPDHDKLIKAFEMFKDWELFCTKAELTLDAGSLPHIKLDFRVAHEDGNWVRRNAVNQVPELLGKLIFPQFRFKLKHLLKYVGPNDEMDKEDKTSNFEG